MRTESKSPSPDNNRKKNDLGPGDENTHRSHHHHIFGYSSSAKFGGLTSKSSKG